MFSRTAAFVADIDLLLTPATIVPAYPVEDRYVAANGITFETYIDWLAIAYAITLTGLPALSLPARLTEDGLPVGMQLVGKTRGEAMLSPQQVENPRPPADTDHPCRRQLSIH